MESLGDILHQKEYTDMCEGLHKEERKIMWEILYLVRKRRRKSKVHDIEERQSV